MDQKKSSLFVIIFFTVMLVISVVVAWVMSRNYAKDINQERGKLNRDMKAATKIVYAYDEKRAKYVYGQFCLRCHAEHGKGSAMAPSLVASPLARGDKDLLIALTVKGLRSEQKGERNYTGVMPGFPMISHQDLAYVLTYIRQAFVQDGESISTQDVIQAKLKFLEQNGAFIRENLQLERDQ